MTCGVYGIFLSESDTCLYVGQSVKIEKRWAHHQNALSNGTHARQDFAKYFHDELLGAMERLDFRILKETSREELNRAEIDAFSLHNPRFYGQRPSLNKRYLTPSEATRGKFTERMTSLIDSARAGFVIEEGRSFWLRDCVQCGVRFRGTSPTSVYCSSACRSEFQSFEKICERCEEPFVAALETTRWCLGRKYFVHRYTMECTVCSKSYDSGRNDSKYCSPVCKYAAAKRRKPAAVAAARYCTVCSEVLPASVIGDLCSSRCKAEARGMKCQSCGDPVEGHRKKLCPVCAVPYYQRIPRERVVEAYTALGVAGAMEELKLSKTGLYRALEFHRVPRVFKSSGRPPS